MSAPQPVEAEVARRSTRRLLWVLLGGYLAFVVYGSLVPLNFVPIPWDEAVRRFARVPYYQLGIESRADWVANGLLFIPLAYLCAALLPDRMPPAVRLLTSALLWLLASVLAVTIEFTQLFFPGRTVGLNDIIAESIGAALGLLLQAGTRRRAAAWLQGWWRREQQAARLLRALHLYLAGLLFYAVMPLDLTISPVELLHKMRHGQGITLMPFSDWPREAAPLAYKGVTDLLLWLPVGLMWRLSGATTVRAATRGLAAAALVETLQLFVYSRHSSMTDIVTGGLGAWLGASLAALWSPQTEPRSSSDVNLGADLRPVARAHRWWAAWVAWLFLALMVFWFPFDFRVDSGMLRERLAQMNQPLLASYYAGSEFHALTELLRKVLVTLPGGLLWALATMRSRGRGRNVLRWLGLLVPVLVACTIEGGQLLLPDKVADFSDVLFESCGGWLGLLLGHGVSGGGLTAVRDGTDEAGFAPTSEIATDRRAAIAGRRPGHPLYASALATWRRPTGETWSATWKADLLGSAALATALVVAGSRPGMPYNVRELFDGREGMVAALVLSWVLWSLWSLPLVLLEQWAVHPEASLRLAYGLPAVVALPSLLMVLGMPEESLGDIVGAPVLGWQDQLEEGLRYAALHATVLLAATGAAWMVVRVASSLRFELLQRWLVVVLVWAVPLHLVIVEWACTDNLVELMRGGGSAGASVLLFGGLTALFGFAFALAAALCGVGWPGCTVRLLWLAALAWPMAVAGLWFGSETALDKYDRTFSAAQFLFSVDRDHYAAAPLLWWRFALACVGLVLAATAVQGPRWRRLARLLREGGAVPAGTSRVRP